MNKNDANWIFYRVSDMLLIKAEALICQMTEGAETDRNEELATEAFALIRAVAERATGSGRSGLTYSNSKSTLLDMVYNERRREFLFEGKRWFDLVRRSRHDNNTDYLIQQVRSKLGESAASATSKLGNMDAIYWPYNYDEVRVNDHLHQNPAYAESENSSFETTN